MGKLNIPLQVNGIQFDRIQSPSVSGIVSVFAMMPDRLISVLYTLVDKIIIDNYSQNTKYASNGQAESTLLYTTQLFNMNKKFNIYSPRKAPSLPHPPPLRAGYWTHTPAVCLGHTVRKPSLTRAFP